MNLTVLKACDLCESVKVIFLKDRSGCLCPGLGVVFVQKVKKVAAFKNMYVFSNNCWYILRIFHLPCHHVVVNLRCVVHETIFYSPAGRLSGIIGNKTELLRRSTCKIGSFLFMSQNCEKEKGIKGLIGDKYFAMNGTYIFPNVSPSFC